MYYEFDEYMKKQQRFMRLRNINRVLDAMRYQPPQTTAQIVDRSGVSRVTVRKILERLREQSVVSVDGKAPTTIEGGKPPWLFSFDPEAKYAVGMHLSFTHLYARIVDLNMRTHAHLQMPLDGDFPIETLLDLIEQATRRLLGEAGIDMKSVVGVGFGGHGVTDFAGGMILVSPHNPSWGRNLRIRDLIHDRLGADLPVYVDNAIRFRTVAERSIGRLKNVQDGVVIHCAEGVISGVMIDGIIRHGRHDLAGSIGHMRVNAGDLEQCACGGYGCFEMQISPARVHSRIHELAAVMGDSPLCSPSHNGIPDLESLFVAADRGDPLSRAVVGEIADWFAAACRNIVFTLDPEVIVIQGIYSDPGSFFRSSLQEKFSHMSLVQVPTTTRICYSKLGEEAASLGAASYVIAEEVG